MMLYVGIFKCSWDITEQLLFQFLEGTTGQDATTTHVSGEEYVSKFSLFLNISHCCSAVLCRLSAPIPGFGS